MKDNEPSMFMKIVVGVGIATLTVLVLLGGWTLIMLVTQ